MMRYLFRPALIAGAILLLVVPTLAANWQYVGSSGFATDPATMQDWFRPVLNSVAADDAGNIYATANNSGNRYGAGGITIFKTNGSKIDVNLNALGLPGGVTKLVKAGDGAVYALQNWREGWLNIINGGGTIPNWRIYGGDGVDRILKITSNGTVSTIWTGNVPWDGWLSTISGGSSTSVVDIDTGKGIQMVDGNATAGQYCRYYTLIRDKEYTAGARFKVDSYTLDPAISTCILEVRPLDSPSTVTFGIFIQNNGSGDRFMLGNCTYPAGNVLKEMVQDLGPVDSSFHEVYLYVNGPAKQVRVRFDGTDYPLYTETNSAKFNTAQWIYNGHLQFGAGTSSGGGGTATVTFDWVGGKPGYETSAAGPWESYADGTPDVASNRDGKPVNFNCRISGMAVGGDGNVYWTTSGPDYYWKYHYLFQYDVLAATVTDIQSGTSNGWSEVAGWNNLEYVGDDRFAVVWENGAGWKLRYMGPTTPKTEVDTSSGEWGRAYVTKSVWDKDRNRYWLGGWPVSGGVTWDETGWVVPAGTASGKIVDLGGGNYGVSVTKQAGAGNYDGWVTKSQDAATGAMLQNDNFTLAARFRIEPGYTDMDGARMLFVRADSKPKPANETDPLQGYAASCGVGIDRIEVSPGVFEDHWVFGLRGRLPVATNIRLVDLGVVVPGVFNEAYIYTERTTRDVPRKTVCYWNGVKVYDGYVSNDDSACGGDGSWMNVGAHCGAFWPTPAGTGTVTFDWFACSKGLVTPSNPTWQTFIDGSVQPQQWGEIRSMIMTVRNGTYGAPGLFNATGAIPGPKKTFHANDNNPQINAHMKTPGYYWVSALDVNPVDGKAWMAWSAEPTYLGSIASGNDIGKVLTRDYNYAYGNEGTPEPGAQVVGLKFVNGFAYALTCNLSSGVYSLYKAAVGTPPGTLSIAAMKGYGVGTIVETNAPKLVTYPKNTGTDQFFYMQDPDGLAGIRVSLNEANSQVMGDYVNVKGILNVVNGELAITNAAVTTASQGNPDATPVGMTTRSVGGQALNGQPATNPAYGLTNVGTLVKIAGNVAAVVTDDMWGRNWFTIDDGSGAVTTYLDSSKVEKTVPGIKVYVDEQFYALPDVDSKVSVVGVSGLDLYYTYTWNSQNLTYGVAGQRMIYAREGADVFTY